MIRPPNTHTLSGNLISHQTWILAFFLMTTMVITAGCEPRISTHGFVPRNDLIEQLQPGEQSKIDVVRILGSPTMLATFDENTWYYVTQTTENKSFFKPRLVDQEILALTFSETGLLQSVGKTGFADAKQIIPEPDKTPTVGKNLTIIQQLFGNLGRFSNPTPGGY